MPSAELTTAGFNSLWPAYVRFLAYLHWPTVRRRRRSFENCCDHPRNRRMIGERSVDTPAARPFAELERRSRVGSESPTRIPLDSGRTPIRTLLPIARPKPNTRRFSRCRSNGPTLVAYCGPRSNVMSQLVPNIDFANLPAPEQGFFVTLFLTVRKVARSCDFYSRVLGGPVVM